MILPALKQATIALGLYRPARKAHTAIFPSLRKKRRDHRKLFAAFVRPGELVYDVGANIGEYTEIFLDLGAKVVGFEPQPKCTRELRARGTPDLTVVERAVGDRCCTVDLHLKSANMQASVLPDWQGGPDIGIITVPMTTLDQAILEYGNPSFIKIDVEGFEAEVISGLASPINLNFEYQCDTLGLEKVRSCLAHLSRLGDVKVNLVGLDRCDWLLPKWVTVNVFLKSFQAVPRLIFGAIST